MRLLGLAGRWRTVLSTCASSGHQPGSGSSRVQAWARTRVKGEWAVAAGGVIGRVGAGSVVWGAGCRVGEGRGAGGAVAVADYQQAVADYQMAVGATPLWATPLCYSSTHA